MTVDTGNQDRTGGTGTNPEQEYVDRLRRAIRGRRAELGLSQAELAGMVGVSQQTINKWEHGGLPDPGKFPLIADALGIPDFGSPGMQMPPRYDRLPDERLCGELSAFRRIVTGRCEPWVLPAALHANPLWLDPGDLAPDERPRPAEEVERALSMRCEQAAYEVARILSFELGIDAGHERLLYQVLLALTRVPGGCLPDLPVLLRGRRGRNLLAQHALFHLPMDEARKEMGVSEETYVMMAHGGVSGEFAGRTFPVGEDAVYDDDSDEHATFRELIARCSMDPLRSVAGMDDGDAMELLSMLHLVLGNPQVACRLSSVWHPDAAPEALSREQTRRSRILASRETTPAVLAQHVDRIRSWDGREALAGICPTCDERVGQRMREEDEEYRRVLDTIAERERVRQERLRMWREQTGGSVPFKEWQAGQLRLWSGQHNRAINDRYYERVVRFLRHLDDDEHIHVVEYHGRDARNIGNLLSEDEEGDWQRMLDIPVRSYGRRKRRR